jgi:hypothetical protein
MSGMVAQESNLRPQGSNPDLGIEDVLRRIGLARGGSGLLACTGAGQQPDVDQLSSSADFVAYEFDICRQFSMGRAGIEPATSGLKVRLDELQRTA